MKKKLLSLFLVLLLLLTACGKKPKGIDTPPNTDNTGKVNEVVVSGNLGNITSGNISRSTVGGNISSYAYIVAVPLGENAGEKVKAEIINNSFSLKLNPDKKYVFYFLNEYGIKENEMQFGADGAAAKISSDMNLGTLTPSSTGMKVDEAKLSESIKTETKEAVKATGELNPELIKKELKETIKQTLEEKNMGTVADGKIIIEVKNEQSTNATNRIEITINESNDSQEESIKFDNIQIVQETKNTNGTISVAKVEVPVGAIDAKANVQIVAAVVTETKTVIQTATNNDVMAEVKKKVEEKAKEVAPTVTIAVTKEEAKTVTFTLAEQTSFRQYIDKVKSTYSEYYGEFESTVNGDKLEFTRENIKEHDSIKLGTTVTEEVTKEGTTYTYKMGTETKTGSTLTSVLPVTLPTLKPVVLFNPDAQNAFKAYVDKIKADYSEFYRVDSTEITAYKLVLKRTNLKAHDSVVKGTVMIEEIVKTTSGFEFIRKTGNNEEKLNIKATVKDVVPSLPSLVAINAFMKTELPSFTNYFNEMRTKYVNFYKEFTIVSTEDKVIITRIATQAHDNINVGDKITEEFTKTLGTYKYNYKVGVTPLKTNSPKEFNLLIPSLPDLIAKGSFDGNWNLTADDFNNINPKTTTELYVEIKKLKAKSNSLSMNYLFDAILSTEALDTELRSEILKTLTGNIPSTEVYKYSENLFKTPADSYKLLTQKGLKALDLIANNLESAYKANETVRFNKTDLTDGYNVIMTPAHFKAMSGAFKTYIAQLNLIASYKFDNNADLVKFIHFVEDKNNYGKIDIAFMRDEFPKLKVLDVDQLIQANALKKMTEGTQELLEAAKALPVINTKLDKNSENMLSITSVIQKELIDGFTLTSNLLKDKGTVVEVLENGKVVAKVRVDLSKLYTLDLKVLIGELLTGTNGKTYEESEEIIKENIEKSTFRGIFPNGLPK